MTTVDDRDRSWFHSQFLALCARKTSFEWQQFVTDLMFARHGADFVQIDPGGTGDKGCDGYVDDLMLACYGAMSPSVAYVKGKIVEDFDKALGNWAESMGRWAFVYNNARGLPLMVAEAIISLKKDKINSGVKIENWPPQVLWDQTCGHLTREKLATILGAPPSDHPAGMNYIARCVESLARTRLVEGLDSVQIVPFGKIEANGFSAEVRELILNFQIHTGHVRFYYSRSSPGEQDQASQVLRAKYDGFRATLPDSDAVFHALCDDLVSEAFMGSPYEDQGEQRNAAIMVVTHFFEQCEIFEAPEVG